MLKSSNLTQQFSSEALLYLIYVWNRTCHRNNKTPFELYGGKKSSVKHLRIFGSKVYVDTPKAKKETNYKCAQ